MDFGRFVPYDKIMSFDQNWYLLDRGILTGIIFYHSKNKVHGFLNTLTFDVEMMFDVITH